MAFDLVRVKDILQRSHRGDVQSELAGALSGAEVADIPSLEGLVPLAGPAAKEMLLLLISSLKELAKKKDLGRRRWIWHPGGPPSGYPPRRDKAKWVSEDF